MFKSTQVKVAAAPINWSNDDMPELGADISLDQCLKEMAEAGYAGCEIGHKFSKTVAVLKPKLEKVQLQIASGWYSTYFTESDKTQSSIEDCRQHMDYLKALGAKVVVVAECGHCTQQQPVPIFERKPVFDENDWRNLIQGLHTLGEIAKEKNMHIVYHYHMGTGVQYYDEIDRLMQSTHPELVSLLLDTGHLYFAGGDNVKLIKAHGVRIKHVHLKDVRKTVLNTVKQEQLSFLEAVKAGVFTVPGDGNILFEPIFEELSKLNYNGWLVVEAEQDPKKANPLEYAIMGRQFIKKAIGV